MDKHCNIHIHSSMNNTIISAVARNGDVQYQLTSGKIGYKKSKRSSAYAGQVLMMECMKYCMQHGYRIYKIYIKGMGQGRDGALKYLGQLSKQDCKITHVIECSPLAHNGCKPRSQRRI